MAKKSTIPNLFSDAEPIIQFEGHPQPKGNNWVKEKILIHKGETEIPEGKYLLDIKQVIHGIPPSKSNCYRIITFKSNKTGANHSSLAKTGKLRNYEKNFILQCTRYRNRNIEGDFEIEVDVFYPNNRSDLDNSLKCLLDCLQHKDVMAIKNDNRCMKIVARKHLDKVNPRLEFILREL